MKHGVKLIKRFDILYPTISICQICMLWKLNVRIVQCQSIKTSTIVVNFSKFKDKGSTRRVHEDFTDRVKRDRRELGKRLVQARKQRSVRFI